MLSNQIKLLLMTPADPYAQDFIIHIYNNYESILDTSSPKYGKQEVPQQQIKSCLKWNIFLDDLLAKPWVLKKKKQQQNIKWKMNRDKLKQFFLSPLEMNHLKQHTYSTN